ncbi:helix-turn-helix transcriptional regulator [Paracoccus sp. AK26]|nr:helix-turn-helix transcriptional regulator [Paracoccus sp. AK26]
MARYIRVRYIRVKNKYARRLFDRTSLKKHYHFMNNIAQIRKVRGLRQNDLAEMVGVTQPHISRIEKGDEGPPLSLFRTIADALNVPLAALFSDERAEAEQMLIDAFRTLPSGRREGWLEMARLIQSEAKAADQEDDRSRGQAD